MSSKKKLSRITLSGMFLALSLILPFFTGQIPQIGNAFCPMHIPVLLCGFFCGAYNAAFVGFIAPLLRFILFGMPTPVPIGLAMSFELATYGGVSGSLYRLLPEKKSSVIIALLVAMVVGRIVWGCASIIFYRLAKSAFGWTIFLSGAFLNSIPGICVQLVVIPVLVLSLKKYTIK